LNSMLAAKLAAKAVLRNGKSVRTQARSISVSKIVKAREAVIVSAVRTPTGSFLGSLANVSATQLGSIVIKGAVEKAGLKPEQVEEVIMGNVLQANIGQSPARQASLGAGLPVSCDVTTVNKVCASGMKAIMYAAQAVMLGHRDIVVAGGMESMSNAPFYVDGKIRKGLKYGNDQFIDSILRDGLTDAYDKIHMGNCGDMTAEKYNITRQQQDDYAIKIYKAAAQATKDGKFVDEIIPVPLPQKKGDPVLFKEDEEFKKAQFDKIPTLKPAFNPKGTVTAANASPLNDGASAVVVMSAERAKALGLTPIARIRGFADAATKPLEFTVAPSLAVPRALQLAGVKASEVDFWELNEAFSVVALVNQQLLNIDPAKLNIRGGAVGLGHAIGSSGARITVTLAHILRQEKGKIGVASICNGGGGASAIVIERI
jgi:acetyl-CoA C-acetyltransferase